MAQAKVAVWGFVVAGILFMVAAFVPVLRGGTMNAVFLPVGIVFLILAAAANKKRGADGFSPCRLTVAAHPG